MAQSKAARAALLTAKDPYKRAKRVVSTTGRYADGGAVDAPQPDLNQQGLYSHAAQIASTALQQQAPPAQVRSTLLNKGVKPDELKWSGFDQKLGTKPMVTRDEVVRHFRSGLPGVQETTLGLESQLHAGYADGSGPTKYHDYQLPGGENYREVLMHLPDAGVEDFQKRHADAKRAQADTLARTKTLLDLHGYGSRHPDILAAMEDHVNANKAFSKVQDEMESRNRASYRSSHWDEPNVLAHLRLSDRKLPSGSKALHLEELQSDWAQEGRDKGFRDANANRMTVANEGGIWRVRDPAGQRVDLNGAAGFGSEEQARAALASNTRDVGGIPSAPYVDSTAKWTDLGLKRALHEAAKGGYDKLLITPGEEQAKRYDLSKQVDAIHVHGRDNEHVDISLKHKGGDWDDEISAVPVARLADHVGKELAEKIVNDRAAHPPARGSFSKEYSGVDLKVGGEGMKSYYDKIVPTALQKLAKKHDPSAEVKLHGHSMTESVVNPNLTEMRNVFRRANQRPPTDNDELRRWLRREYGDGRHDEMFAEPTKLHSIDITPKMRASILKGQPAYARGGRTGRDDVWDRFHKAVSYARGGRTEIDDKLLGSLKRPGSGYVPVRNKPGTVKIPGYGEVEARPIDAIEQSAAKYMKGQGRHHDNEFSPFNEEFARKVADAFERMEHNPRDPKVKRAYDALIDETLAQYHAARDTGIDFKFLKPGEADPYARSPSLGYADIVNKGKLHVFPTDAGYGQGEASDNPLLKRVGKIGDLNNATVNDAFRIVHDIYGHFGPGNPFFRAPGEERAFRQHSQMYGPEARKAAATETRGQNSWVNYGPKAAQNKGASGADTVYAEQKAGLLPDEFMGDAPIAKADGGSIGAVPDDHPIVQKALQVVSQQVPDVAQQEKTASNASLARLLDKTRQTQVGRMVDRYQNPSPMTATKRLHGDLSGLTKEGEPGRMWYEKSSKRILDYVGGDKNEADKFAQLIAIYSPQTAVDVNTQNAIKAYNRAKAGQQLWNGEILERDRSFDTIKAANDYTKGLGRGATKIPLDDSGKRFLFARHGDIKDYDNIATLDRDLKAHLVMNEGIPFEGRKINNFYNNLMTHIDPDRKQGSTQDLWMARAFGFHDDAVGAATKYDFMEKLTHKLATEMGWKPHQVQAAIWTAMKTRQEAVKHDVRREAAAQGIGTMVPGPTGKPQFTVTPGKEDEYSSLMRERALQTVLDPNHIRNSARDFSDFLDQNLAHVSWEATPSRQIAHLQGLEQKPPQVKADYHKRISDALQDEQGNDLLAKYIGMLSPGTVEAPGYWQGEINPATHQLVGSTRIKAAGQRPDIDEASKELMNIYADARGLLLKQDGVGYHRPYFNPQVSKANGVEYRFDKPLSGDEIRRLGALIDQHVPDTAVVPVGPDTVRVINFSGMDDHKPYHRAVDEAVGKADIGAATAQRRVFASDGDLRTNDWKASPNGEDYRQRLGASRRPDVLRYLSDVLAPKVEAVDEGFAKEHGLARDRRLEKALRQLHEVGEELPKARASGGAVNHTPTDAQKSAGNYAKRKMSFQGIPITIENELGSTRSGRDDRGRAWSCKLPADYGYIRNTLGADGDHVDCYVGPDANSNLVVVVNQRHLHGERAFDEHKALVGFPSEKAGIDCYVKAFSDGKGADRIKSVEVMSVDAFKKWLRRGKTTSPANGRSIVDRALQLVHKGA